MNLGGPEGDYVRCEAADGSGTNNANFSPSGARMQMFLWPGNQLGSQNLVSVPGVGDFGAGWARFGPPATNAGVSGQLANVGNGCVAGDYAGGCRRDDRGRRPATTPAARTSTRRRAASAAGAKALVLASGSGTNSTTILTGSQTTAPPTIPSVAVTQADGDAIRAAILAGPTSGTVRSTRAIRASATATSRTGSSSTSTGTASPTA